MDTHYYVWFTLAFRSGSKQEHPVPHKPRHRLASPSWRASSFSSTYTPEMPSGIASLIASLKEGAKPRGNWAPGGKRELWQHEPASMDDLEIWFGKGVTDGLPVVPPTRERVERMLEGTTRGRSELVGEVAPNYGRATVEKIAINAVMAGCRPDYLPVVLAAVEAACDPPFNLHGMSTSTHFSAPLIVVNGPIRERIALNCSFGVFGPGFRANATIGRALRLVMINVGGVRPGETSMSTFAHPGRYTYCIGEHEEASPWDSLAVEHGFAATDDTVALLAADAPLTVYDQRSRTAADLLATVAASMAVIEHHKMTHWGDTLLLLSPEHAA